MRGCGRGDRGTGEGIGLVIRTEAVIIPLSWRVVRSAGLTTLSRQNKIYLFVFSFLNSNAIKFPVFLIISMLSALKHFWTLSSSVMLKCVFIFWFKKRTVHLYFSNYKIKTSVFELFFCCCCIQWIVLHFSTLGLVFNKQ